MPSTLIARCASKRRASALSALSTSEHPRSPFACRTMEIWTARGPPAPLWAQRVPRVPHVAIVRPDGECVRAIVTDEGVLCHIDGGWVQVTAGDGDLARVEPRRSLSEWLGGARVRSLDAIRHSASHFRSFRAFAIAAHVEPNENATTRAYERANVLSNVSETPRWVTPFQFDVFDFRHGGEFDRFVAYVHACMFHRRNVRVTEPPVARPSLPP